MRPSRSSSSEELLERIAHIVGVPVETFHGWRECLEHSDGNEDVEAMSAELVAAFRQIGNPAIQGGVLTLVKKLASGQNRAPG